MSNVPPSPARATAQAALSIGALGVVFGDIGTSPLYTMRECLAHLPAGDQTEGVLGILSLIFWALILVVSVKYLGFVMRASNQGEGGIFALLALIQGKRAQAEGGRRSIIGPATLMTIVGASLLFGEGVITPAISVLGAAEGFHTLSPVFDPYVTWIAAVILAGLFWIQHRGTEQIGRMFGPVMLLWFAVLGGLGIWHLAQNPGVLRALNPVHALWLLEHPPREVALLLGSIVLAITGVEALYADMGHFGRRTIGLAWYGAALPGLVLNYFGQGALILENPEAAANPFFALASEGVGRALLTALSIAAAIIASQALISGAFSIARQAIQLGFLPRLKIQHTNAEHSGQIYVPFVNAVLAIFCILTVAGFRSSENLAGAYGIAVTGTMVITSLSFFLVTRRRWRWKLIASLALCAGFLVIDVTLFGSTLGKIKDGGWFPLVIGAGLIALMHTWKVGRTEIYRRVYGNNVTEDELKDIACSKYVTRVSGGAVFMVGSPQGAPVALLHHVKSNRVLHQTVVLLTIGTEEVPEVAEADRLELREIGEGIWRAIGHYGYMESPDVAALMEQVKERGAPINWQAATYFFNREMIISGGDSRMWNWQKGLYGVLSRNARPAKDYYQIPPAQIIELGLPITL